MINELTTCEKCGKEESCWQQPVNEFHNAYTCFNCGFATSDLMIDGEFDFTEIESTMPELYKDIKYKDQKGRVWYPHVINIEDKGTVFANGTDKDNWQWSAIKTKKLTKKEQKEPRFNGKTHKSDPKTMKSFSSDYFSACDYIGLFDIQTNK
jgi:hypothetical protein